MDNETLLYFSGEVKALGNGRIGGYVIRFGDPKNVDLAKDYFTPATDIDYYENKQITLYYNHGTDPVLKSRKLGKGAIVKTDDVGHWFEAQLAMRDSYEEAVYKLIEENAAGFSSGSAPHLVERKSVGTVSEITSWPLVEASITTSPCEFRNTIVPLKSYLDTIKPDVTIPATDEEEAEDDGQTKPSSFSAKGLFESELAERRMSVWDLWAILNTVFSQIAKAASVRDITGVPVDVSSLVAEAVSAFASRVVIAATEQITEYASEDREYEFYIKGFERALLQTFLANGSVASHGPFLDHSEEMASVVAEFAKEAGDVLKGMEAYAARAQNKAKFRADTKSGRVISQANLDFIGTACDDLMHIGEKSRQIHGNLMALMDAAKPKEKAELPGEVVGLLSNHSERLRKVRLEFLRTEAALSAAA